MDHHRSAPDDGDAARLRRRAADWHAAAVTGRELDREIAREQTPAERLTRGLDLVRVAEKLRRINRP